MIRKFRAIKWDHWVLITSLLAIGVCAVLTAPLNARAKQSEKTVKNEVAKPSKEDGDHSHDLELHFHGLPQSTFPSESSFESRHMKSHESSQFT